MIFCICGCSGGYMYQNSAPLEFSDFDYGFKSHYLKVDGINISYIDEGNNDKVLLVVHGLASNAGFWRENIKPLSEKYRVIAVDLPGYGKSDKGNYQYNMTFYANILSKFVKQLGISKINYLGHSMGGQIGIWFSLLHADQLDKLILASPAGIEKFNTGEGDWMKNVMTINFIKTTPEERIRANLSGNFYSYDDKFEWMVEERTRMAKAKDFENFCYAVTRCVHGMLDEPTTAKLKDIKTPTTIIFGEKDGLIPNPILHGGCSKDIGDVGVRDIPNSKIFYIPNAGHMLQLEQPQEFNRLVINNLEK